MTQQPPNLHLLLSSGTSLLALLQLKLTTRTGLCPDASLTLLSPAPNLKSAENRSLLAARLGLVQCPVVGQQQASAFCSPQSQLAHVSIHLGMFPITKQAPCLYMGW